MVRTEDISSSRVALDTIVNDDKCNTVQCVSTVLHRFEEYNIEIDEVYGQCVVEEIGLLERSGALSSESGDIKEVVNICGFTILQ